MFKWTVHTNIRSNKKYPLYNNLFSMFHTYIYSVTLGVILKIRDVSNVSLLTYSE